MKKVGVIGVGSMGGNHARIYNELADLVAVCDFDANKAKEVAKRFGCINAVSTEAPALMFTDTIAAMPGVWSSTGLRG